LLKRSLISLLILGVAVSVYATEDPIADLKRSLPELNEQLRRLDIDEQIKSKGKLDLHSHPIDNVEDPTDAQDAATKAYVDSEVASGSKWEIDGTETQLKTADEIDMQSKKIINLTDPASAQDASTKNYVDTFAGSSNIVTVGSVAAGDLGGWNVVTGYLYNLQSGTPTSSPNDGIVLASGNEGIIIYEDTAKRVELGYLSSGVYGLKVYDSGGSNVMFELSDTQQVIAGWNIVLGYIYNLQSGTPTSTPSDGIVIASGNEGVTIYEDTAKRVELGYLSSGVYGLKGYATNGSDVIFELSDTQQKVGGWYFTDTVLTDNTTQASAKVLIDSGNTLIRLGPTAGDYITLDGNAQTIQSSNYVSGALGSGFTLQPDLLEVGNIRARGKITTSVFEKETISTVGGNLLVLSGDVLDADMTALDASTMTITGDVTFAVNDILRMKDASNDEWFKVTNIGSAPTYTVTRDQASDYAADTNPIWKTGTAVASYGQSGTGGIFMTSSEGNSPYIHFFTHAGSPWSATTAKTRIGNLDGIAGASGWGIWAGDGYLGALEVIDIISISSQGSIRSNLTGNYPYVEFSNSGLMLKDSDTGGTYGTVAYTTTGVYGYGALGWILNSDLKIPFVVLKEPNAGANDVADMRLYNRGDDPGGAAEIGDLCVVNGKLKICTGAGTPGSWTVVGAQTP